MTSADIAPDQHQQGADLGERVAGWAKGLGEQLSGLFSRDKEQADNAEAAEPVTEPKPPVEPEPVEQDTGDQHEQAEDIGEKIINALTGGREEPIEVVESIAPSIATLPQPSTQIARAEEALEAAPADQATQPPPSPAEVTEAVSGEVVGTWNGIASRDKALIEKAYFSLTGQRVDLAGASGTQGEELFDPGTAWVVGQIQAAANLQQDQLFGPKTRAEAERHSAAEETSQAKVQEIRQTLTAIATGQAANGGSPIRADSTPESDRRIAKIQELLNARNRHYGRPEIAVTGQADQEFYQQIGAYQQENSLIHDEILGRQTAEGLLITLAHPGVQAELQR